VLISYGEIEGGTTIEESAQLFMNIISGQEQQLKTIMFCANAGMAIASQRMQSYGRI
jgi:anthranilate phosphoribosyltransferase